jgi:protein involved in ribonucleotide reduction
MILIKRNILDFSYLPKRGVNKKSKTRNQKKKQNIEKQTHKFIQKINTQNKKIQTHKTQRQHIVCDIHIICTIYVILTE